MKRNCMPIPTYCGLIPYCELQGRKQNHLSSNQDFHLRGPKKERDINTGLQRDYAYVICVMVVSIYRPASTSIYLYNTLQWYLRAVSESWRPESPHWLVFYKAFSPATNTHTPILGWKCYQNINVQLTHLVNLAIEFVY